MHFSKVVGWTDYYSFKIFRHCSLVPIPWLILHNKWAHTIFGRWEQYTINSTVYLVGHEAAWANKKWTKKMAFMAIRRWNSWTSDLNWMGEMQKYAKHIAQWILSSFWGVPARWNIRLYPKSTPRNRPKFWRKSQGGRHVENLETFWMNNKTVIEFGYHTMWRIMQISEDDIYLALQPRWIIRTQPHSIMFCKLSQPWLSLCWPLFCESGSIVLLIKLTV